MALSPKVDAETRNIQIEAAVVNSKRELLPGMFVSVEVEAGAAQTFLTLPQTTVTFNPYGETVFVVTESGKDDDGKPVLAAKQTFVTVGERRGDQLSVLSGIKEGDQVVTSGQHKLRNNSSIVIDNQVQPSNQPAPNPVDQ